MAKNKHPRKKKGTNNCAVEQLTVWFWIPVHILKTAFSLQVPKPSVGVRGKISMGIPGIMP